MKNAEVFFVWMTSDQNLSIRNTAQFVLKIFKDNSELALVKTTKLDCKNNINGKLEMMQKLSTVA